MNIFSRIAGREASSAYALGAPSSNPELRKATFAAMTGGRGFRQPKKPTATVQDGKTRGEIKRETRRKFVESFKGESRPAKHMHAHARKWLSRTGSTS